MLHRLLLLIAGLTLCAASAEAQPTLPAPCQATRADTMPALELRRQTLERQVGSETAALDLAKKNVPPQPAAKIKELDQKLKKTQADLVEVLFRIDCVRVAPPPPAAQPRSVRAVATSPEQVEVTTYYATNRSPTGSAEAAKFYASGFADHLQYGRAVVSIPFGHKPGSLELPTLWKLERTPDPNKHFVLKSVTPLNGDAVQREMASRLQSSHKKAILIFVHGYYVDFNEAALRTAQLAHDLKFQGLPVFFSWPSASQMRGYLKDEEAAQLSEGVFDQFIDEMSQLPATEIYLVAHSMGNRIVANVLQSRVDRKKTTDKLRELLLAAPDINAELFQRVIAPKLAEMQRTRTTVYASSSDIALTVSKAMHGFRRVGETSGGVFTYPGFDTIDASSASLITRAYGHSYVMDSVPVMKDVETIIEKNINAKQRGLTEAGTRPNNFFRLP